jgi:hypothetical protein
MKTLHRSIGCRDSPKQRCRNYPTSSRRRPLTVCRSIADPDTPLAQPLAKIYASANANIKAVVDILCKFNRMLFLSLPGRHLCCKGNSFVIQSSLCLLAELQFGSDSLLSLLFAGRSNRDWRLSVSSAILE